jgi:DNA modification methylase
MGSGTTALASVQLGRSFIGVDINPEYITLAQDRISDTQMKLPSIAEKRVAYVVGENLNGSHITTEHATR